MVAHAASPSGPPRACSPPLRTALHTFPHQRISMTVGSPCRLGWKRCTACVQRAGSVAPVRSRRASLRVLGKAWEGLGSAHLPVRTVRQTYGLRSCPAATLAVVGFESDLFWPQGVKMCHLFVVHSDVALRHGESRRKSAPDAAVVEAFPPSVRRTFICICTG
jgi:hypothetical protein